MIQSCVRPGCDNIFEDLNQGLVYSLERRPSGTTEFLWLCAECQPNFAVTLSPEGEIEVVERNWLIVRPLPNPRADLRLYSARFRKPVAA